MSSVNVVLSMLGGSYCRRWTVLGPERGERSKDCLSMRMWEQSRVTAVMAVGRARRRRDREGDIVIKASNRLGKRCGRRIC